jgi:hypothetical protein
MLVYLLGFELPGRIPLNYNHKASTNEASAGPTNNYLGPFNKLLKMQGHRNPYHFGNSFRSYDGLSGERQAQTYEHQSNAVYFSWSQNISSKAEIRVRHN